MYLAREAFQNKSSDIGLVSQMVSYKIRFEISLAILSKHKCIEHYIYMMSRCICISTKLRYLFQKR
jgi:hypothetical protein